MVVVMGQDIEMKADLSARLTLVCSHLTQQYASDKLAPGIHFAWLADQAKWYVSFKRFKSGKEDENIFVKAVCGTPEEALEQCYKTWIGLLESYNVETSSPK